MHLLVQRSRSSAKVKAKYKGYISQKLAISGAFMFHKDILLFIENLNGLNRSVYEVCLSLLCFLGPYAKIQKNSENFMSRTARHTV